jgi:hypothetical protein
VALQIEQTDPASLLVRDDGDSVCEVRELKLQNVRLRPGGRRIISDDVPLPMFWEQYANHQHPDKNAGSHGTARVLTSNGDNVVVECTGATATRNVLSRYVLTVSRVASPVSYIFEVEAMLKVQVGQTWHVTPNPQHGEVEFCNFWPNGAYSSDLQRANLYQGCFVIRPSGTIKIPHHHLESSDKHNILLRPGDKVAWLLEEENPCVELLMSGHVTAGICAYMWDAHLAYKVCHDRVDRDLPGGTEFQVKFRLSGLSLVEARHINEVASESVSPETSRTPIITEGVNRFSDTLESCNGDAADAWPWENETIRGGAGNVRFSVDHGTGYDDRVALRIDAHTWCRAMWKATAFGPAYRKPPFRDGERFKLTAFVKTNLVDGNSGIAIRLHRPGRSDVFDIAVYEVYRCPKMVTGSSEWTPLEILTPSITPAPDRLHVLLELNGKGTCWFDNVHVMSQA